MDMKLDINCYHIYYYIMLMLLLSSTMRILEQLGVACEAV